MFLQLTMESRHFCKQMILLLLGLFFFLSLLAFETLYDPSGSVYIRLLLRLQNFNALFRYDFELCRNFIQLSTERSSTTRNMNNNNHNIKEGFRKQNVENYKFVFSCEMALTKSFECCSVQKLCK